MQCVETLLSRRTVSLEEFSAITISKHPNASLSMAPFKSWLHSLMMMLIPGTLVAKIPELKLLLVTTMATLTQTPQHFRASSWYLRMWLNLSHYSRLRRIQQLNLQRQFNLTSKMETSKGMTEKIPSPLFKMLKAAGSTSGLSTMVPKERLLFPMEQILSRVSLTMWMEAMHLSISSMDPTEEALNPLNTIKCRSSSRTSASR